MNAQTIVERYRTFLLALAAFMCVGTVIELIFAQHTQEPLQFVPFILLGLAFAIIVAVLIRPSRLTIQTLRITMGALVLGSLVGVFEHFQGNTEILLETKPNLTGLDVVWGALRGAAPMLAPGILVLIALLAVAATYYHPALQTKTSG